jgi:hypothetical protein
MLSLLQREAHGAALAAATAAPSLPRSLHIDAHLIEVRLPLVGRRGLQR